VAAYPISPQEPASTSTPPAHTRTPSTSTVARAAASAPRSAVRGHRHGTGGGVRWDRDSGRTS
jgi:hypothetical protein